MDPVPTPAEELLAVDRELSRLDARRAQLLDRRAWLLRALQPPAPWGGPPQAQPWGAWGAPPPGVARASARHGAQHVLLTLGGLLLAVAAIAFTLFSWGSLGIGGRTAVLVTVTAGALAAPALLLRRRLSATADAVAALAMLLTLLDAVAWYGLTGPDLGGAAYAAVAFGVLAAAWTAYGLLVRGLSLPLPAAVLAGQLPLVLWAWAAGAGALGHGWALLVTAVADGAVALWVTRRGVRVTAGVCAAVTGAWALLVALVESVWPSGVVGALAPGALLLAGAAAALYAGRRMPDRLAPVAGAVAGLAAVAAVGGPVRAAAGPEWAVVGYLLCGVALVAVVRVPLSAAVRTGVLVAAAAVAAGSVLWTLPSVVLVLGGPLSGSGDVWAGAPEGFRAALDARWPWGAPAPVVLLLTAVVLGAVYRRGVPGRPADARLRTAAGAGALGSGWAGVLLVVVALDVPYPVALLVEVALVAGLLVVVSGADRPAAVVRTALGCAVVGGGSLVALSLAAEPATYAVTLALCALAAGAAVRARAAAVRAVTAGAAVLVAVVPACALGPSLGLPVAAGALPVLLVPASTVALGAVLRRRPVAVVVESAGAFAALVAVAVAVTDAGYWALVLALCGVLASATAVRPERRRTAGAAAVALFVAAAWVRLAAWEVTAPEAYTLPVTLPALAVGVLRRRRDPEASSWTAYGAGLAVTLVPGVVAVWTDPGWLRPLLLGLGALALTLAGARFRLAAPLLLGGGALALVGLHELTPVVAQVAGALPRWLPPALAGVLLLVVGATYERRMRDARRLREALTRLR
ncbi:SCO7613 C-terminal domain-containing membrane protein [uncultured Streptomyces sp.]|uniref:SCO7613 C-terminal domain-containing membrane protein n=1 Tax=uncultured Streptomyces sp. TaxID=174707 RepID=UPI00261E28BD|nr:hypothetical protein [uncultured Streptomyces sp.]